MTRLPGPCSRDIPNPNGSLSWHYNFGKQGIELDLDSADGQQAFRELAASAVSLKPAHRHTCPTATSDTKISPS